MNTVDRGCSLGMAGTNPLDQLLLLFGQPGKFQVFLFILLCTNAYPITFNFLYITFYTYTPPHYCNVPNKNASIPPEDYHPVDKDGNWLKCDVYRDPANHSLGIESCQQGYYFNRTEYAEKTISEEWNLVCDDKFMAPLASTIFFAGVMVGGLICGTLADKFGRRPVVLGTLYGQAVLGIVIAFSANYYMFVVLKFFQGILIQGLQSSNNSLVMELFPLCYRTLAGMILAMCATSTHMFMSPLLYFLPYWNWMQLLISLLTSVSLLYSWLYPESLRWLLSQERHDDALKVARRFAKANKVVLPDNINDQMRAISRDITEKAQASKQNDVRDLFRSPIMCRYTVSLLFSWFAVSTTYYGIQFYIPKMSGGNFRYLNLFWSGALETAARVVGFFIVDRLGRRRPLVFFYSMSGLLCIASGLSGNFELKTLSNVLAIFGKLCSAQCFAFILLFSSEIFPTPIRTVGLGAVACFARIGNMAAPQLLELKNYTHLYVPFIIFGSLSFISAAIIFFMPETKGRPLPNTIHDIEAFHQATDSIFPTHETDSKTNKEEKGVDNLGLERSPQPPPKAKHTPTESYKTVSQS